MLAAFDGVDNFGAWDISHKFMIMFITAGISNGNKTAQSLEREIYEVLHNSHNSFYSAVNAFTALGKMYNEIVGKIKTGREETKQ